MARIRSVKPEFPQSESMGRVSRESRLCFILLWTLSDDSGRLRGNSRMLASLLYPYDVDAGNLIDGWLDELDKEGCLVRYSVGTDTYIQICNWLKHQKIDKPSASKIPQFDESSRILANPRERSSGDLRIGSEDQGSKEGKGSKDHLGAPRRAVKDDPEGFEAIQKAYPRRGGGQRWDDAKKGYARSLAAGASPADILAGVERYAYHIRADSKEGTPYVQQAATFLGANESWREGWEPVKQQKVLSAVDRVNIAYEAKNESVVSTQSRQGFGDLEILDTDVRRQDSTGLRRIGS